MNTFKKTIGTIAAIFFGLVTIFWILTPLVIVPFGLCLLSIFSLLKISNADVIKIKMFKTISIILFILLVLYAWRQHTCSPYYPLNVKMQIDGVYEKARMKSCMTFGIYKNTVIPEWIKNPQP